MPSSHKTSPTTTAALARQKALTPVYISGLTGVHTLETGVAYYYRGHYLYAAPAGTLLEPIPFSTRRGIAIRGVFAPEAPTYDAGARGLREESEIRALEGSVRAEVERQGGEKGAEDEALEAIDGAESIVRRRAEELPGSVSSLAALRSGGRTAFTPRFGAGLLAASAPGSRLGSRSASPLGLRPVASLARLGAIRGPDFFFDDDGWSEANSRAEEGVARTSEALWLPGLGDHKLAKGDLASAKVERVEPCAIHGEVCDGVGVERGCLTEEARKGRGFVEEVPMMEAGGRQMVDWAGLLEEATCG